MERCKGDAEVYGVVFNGGLDGVGFEDCVLMAPSQLGRVLWRGWNVRLTMARTLDRSQAIFSRQASIKTSDVRPNLTALLWDNGEA